MQCESCSDGVSEGMWGLWQRGWPRGCSDGEKGKVRLGAAGAVKATLMSLQRLLKARASSSPCRRHHVIAEPSRDVVPASSSPPSLGAPPVAIASSPAFGACGCTCRITQHPRIPHLVRRGFTRYPHLSPRLHSILASLTYPHPAWVRSEDPNQEAPAARACSKHPVSL